MASTLAGNLTITGSVANIIVVEKARTVTHISFLDYMKTGVPVTLPTLAVGWCGWDSCATNLVRPAIIARRSLKPETCPSLPIALIGGEAQFRGQLALGQVSGHARANLVAVDVFLKKHQHRWARAAERNSVNSLRA